MMWCRLVGLDKCPGVRQIGIGNILRRLVSKVLLIVVGNETTRACGTDQLRSGLEAEIEEGGGGIIMLELYGRCMNMMKKGGGLVN